MEWESIVNQHSHAKKQNEYQKRRWKYQRRAIIAVAIVFAFALTTLLGLVHPGLGKSVILIALSFDWYYIGRIKELENK